METASTNIWGQRNSPPQPRRGGRDIKKIAKLLIGADGVVLVEENNPGQHHPVCAFKGGFAVSY